MAARVTVSGLRKATTEANRAIMRTRAGIEAGLRAAGKFVEKESRDRTPVDEGELKASHYTSDVVGNKKKQVIVGATQNYAIFVHEDLEAFHDGAGETAKFLERAYFDNQQKVTNIIINAARQGG